MYSNISPEVVSYKKFRRLLLAFWCLSAMLLQTGCASSGGYKFTREEAVFQAFHIADVVQTMRIKDSPCHYERNDGTAFLIGEQPSKERVALWGILVGVGHWIFSEEIRKRSTGKYKPAYTFWQIFSTGFKINTVYQNEKIGLGVEGIDCPPQQVIYVDNLGEPIE